MTSAALTVRNFAVFRGLFSRTDAICPELTGLFRIEPNGRVTHIDVGLWRDTELPRRDSKGMEISHVPAPDDFSYRQRVAMEFCRIDIDITRAAETGWRVDAIVVIGTAGCQG